MPTLTNDTGTLNWRERLEWYLWYVWCLFFGDHEGEEVEEKNAPKKYPDLTWRPEAEISLAIESSPDAAVTLKIFYDHYGDDHPIQFTDCLIVFNVDPDKVPEDELVYVDMKGKEGYTIDLSEMIAAAIGWEMTSWTVFKLFDLDMVLMFDTMVMHYELKQEWFLPVPEEAIVW